MAHCGGCDPLKSGYRLSSPPAVLSALYLPHHMAAHVKVQPTTVATVFDLVFHLSHGDRLIARSAYAPRAVPGTDLCRHHYGQPTILDQLANAQP